MISVTEHHHEEMSSDGVPWKVIAQIVLWVAIAASGYVWKQTIDRVTKVEETVYARGERIAILEANAVSDRRAILELKTQLERFEEKLDKVLQQVRTSYEPPHATFQRGTAFDK